MTFHFISTSELNLVILLLTTYETVTQWLLTYQGLLIHVWKYCYDNTDMLIISYHCCLQKCTLGPVVTLKCEYVRLIVSGLWWTPPPPPSPQPQWTLWLHECVSRIPQATVASNTKRYLLNRDIKMSKSFFFGWLFAHTCSLLIFRRRRRRRLTGQFKMPFCFYSETLHLLSHGCVLGLALRWFQRWAILKVIKRLIVKQTGIKDGILLTCTHYMGWSEGNRPYKAPWGWGWGLYWCMVLAGHS